jgi:hypothetical protein
MKLKLLILFCLLPVLTVSAAWFGRLLREGVEQRMERQLIREGSEHLIVTTPVRTRHLWIQAAPRLLLSGAAGGSLWMATDRLTDPDPESGKVSFRIPLALLLTALLILRFAPPFRSRKTKSD